MKSTDIPILSATDRLQRALLRWVDLCGISGHYEVAGDVETSMTELSMLDEQSYIIGVVGKNPSDWPIIWSGQAVLIQAGRDFGPAVAEWVGEPRLLALFAQEYVDAVRYRRAAARRFSRSSGESDDAIDQLIFPLRDKSSFEYVLVQGEVVSGALLYSQRNPAQDGDVS
ncbi:MAG: hypothetical protein KDC18_04480 [Alphaproteobacteria bacterium]|nr:hypothetical protein [Alphaproteobacteria bacterium]MCB9930126.1 hypothetical protein [Alphaproteobacteria bacterium]